MMQTSTLRPLPPKNRARSGKFCVVWRNGAGIEGGNFFNGPRENSAGGGMASLRHCRLLTSGGYGIRESPQARRNL